MCVFVMDKFLIILLCSLGVITAHPVSFLRKLIDNDVEKHSNVLVKSNDFPKFHYSTFGENAPHVDDDLLNIDFQTHPRTLDTVNEVMKIVTEGASVSLDIFKDVTKMIITTLQPETTRDTYETTANPEATNGTVHTLPIKQSQINPVWADDTNSTSNRTTRQESAEEIETNAKQDTPEEEEEPENPAVGLISAFLGGLSSPEGGVDLEAITGLLGTLSSQRPDGSYEFSGLVDLLMSFFGGMGDGGSDVGAFVGGLVGALVQGLANPPGANGAGTFLGNILGGILPGLSAPAPAGDGDSQRPQQGLDSGGFLSGLLSSLLGNLGGLSNSSGGSSTTNTGQGGDNKFSLFKAIFSSITSIFSSSSSANSHS